MFSLQKLNEFYSTGKSVSGAVCILSGFWCCLHFEPCFSCVFQISSALKYLHRHQIIYRDLKCENVLVWAFPGPTIADPVNHQVLLKLTDYGISRSVSLGGIKGFLGTPGFMAPEILKYTGKESYSAKVRFLFLEFFFFLHKP